jgi:hypothetical protein
MYGADRDQAQLWYCHKSELLACDWLIEEGRPTLVLSKKVSRSKSDGQEVAGVDLSSLVARDHLISVNFLDK